MRPEPGLSAARSDRLAGPGGERRPCRRLRQGVQLRPGAPQADPDGDQAAAASA